VTGKLLLQAVAVLALLGGTAAAQEAGGLNVTGRGFGPLPNSMLPQTTAAGNPFRAPSDVRAANPARARQTVDQQAITSIRGDAGYLAGFQFGQPVAASRQPPPDLTPPTDLTVIEQPFILNNQDSVVSLAVGDGNTSQQDLGKSPAPATAAKTPSPAGTPASLAATLAQAFGTPVVTNTNSLVNMAVGSGNVARQRVDTGR
jgi:hypothetical protein